MSKIKKPFELRLQDERFKPVAGYEAYYEVSNYGVVRSLDRTIITSAKQVYVKKGRVLKFFTGRDGYSYIDLKVNNTKKRYPVHQLVWDTFSGIPRTHPNSIVVDHKNEVKTDNRYCNLQLLSKRDNAIKCQTHGHLPGCSKYKGRWQARITINGKEKHLGRFDTQEEANAKYMEARAAIQQ